MGYKLAGCRGDNIPVPQLVFAKLPQLEDDWLRVALHIIATGETAIYANVLLKKGVVK